jgi:signal recognition particle subunit SRP68
LKLLVLEHSLLTLNYRSLAIARSHSIAGNAINALALTKYALDKAQEALPILRTAQAEHTPLNIIVAGPDAKRLSDLLSGELQVSRALVEMENIQKSDKRSGANVAPLPLVERLSEYPSEGVDLDNIVVYPPRADAIPVKPLFLDVAWNYINYPSKHVKQEQKPKNAAPEKGTGAGEAKPQKRGWFGFGR